MGMISRGIKNAFRNTIRTLSITLILALSIALALVMFMSLKTVQAKIDSVKSSIGNTITVSPAGVRGFEGGGTLLTDQNVTDIKALPHVSSIVETLTDRLRNTADTSQNNFPGGNSSSSTSNNTTNLTSPITPGSFGNRQRQETGGNTNTTFSMPVSVTGINTLDSLTGLGVSSFKLTSGAKIDPSVSTNIAMVGKDLATKNNLTVGSTFTAYGQTVTVKGIYDTGNTFTNAGIVMPIKSVQTLSAQAGQINTIIVQTDSIDTLSSVTASIKTKLGAAADVVSSQDSSQNALTPLQNIKTISTYSLIGALAAGSVIIFMTMLMIVRERRREIGVLKAIGSSNLNIMSQFAVESLTLTVLAGVVGVVIGAISSNPVLNVLVNNSTSSTTTAGQGGFGGGRGAGGAIMRFGGNFIPGAQNTLRNLHAVVGWEVALYGLGAIVIIAILGSAIPSYLIAKVRPAEVMRAE